MAALSAGDACKATRPKRLLRARPRAGGSGRTLVEAAPVLSDESLATAHCTWGGTVVLSKYRTLDHLNQNPSWLHISWTLGPPCASPRAGICRGAPPRPRRRPRPPHPKPRSSPAFFANLVGGWACGARRARGEVAAQVEGARRAGARDGRDPRQPRADADAPGGPKENATRLGARGGEQGITRAAPPQSREVALPELEPISNFTEARDRLQSRRAPV